MTNTMRGLNCFLLVFISIAGNIYCQSNTMAAGNDASAASGSISYSIGQIDYVTATSGTGTLTQGVQQPFEIVEVSSLQESQEMIVRLYPNPATEQVILEFTEDDFIKGSFSCALADLQGKNLFSQFLVQQKTMLDIGNLSTGIYFMTLYNQQKVIKTYKIIKK